MPGDRVDFHLDVSIPFIAGQWSLRACADDAFFDELES